MNLGDFFVVSVLPSKKSPGRPAAKKKARDRGHFDPMYVFWGDIDRSKIPDPKAPEKGRPRAERD